MITRLPAGFFECVPVPDIDVESASIERAAKTENVCNLWSKRWFRAWLHSASAVVSGNSQYIANNTAWPDTPRMSSTEVMNQKDASLLLETPIRGLAEGGSGK